MLSLFWPCSTFFSAAFQKISPSSCSPLFHFFTWHNQVSIPPPSPLPFNHFPFSCFSFSALFFTLDPLLFFFIVFFCTVPPLSSFSPLPCGPPASFPLWSLQKSVSYYLPIQINMYISTRIYCWKRCEYEPRDLPFMISENW